MLRNWEKLTDAQRALSPDQLMVEIRKLYPKAEIPGPQRRLRLEGDRIINEEVPLVPNFSSKKLGDTDKSQEVSFVEHKIRFKGDEGTGRFQLTS
ncbi:MAG: hypothetical protein IPG59_01590 [Candidatus Melainabacteria bacterium]|nr:MAG: hypothetical protein IPG59_01590 [Candidatus Melainabacteria bacterium]